MQDTRSEELLQPIVPRTKERRRKFDVWTKLELAREAQATSLNAVSKKYDVARQNLRLWIRTYAQLERRAQEQQQQQQQHGSDDRAQLYRLHGAGRRVSCSQLDEALAQRVAEQFARGAAVTRRLLHEWALELKASLQSDAAVVPTWISRFMRRHGVSTTSSGAVVPTDPSAPDQQRRKRAVVSNADKLAITQFFETSGRDMETTLRAFFGPITDPKVRQVKVRSIYHWLQHRDTIAQRVHSARLQQTAAVGVDDRSVAVGYTDRICNSDSVDYDASGRDGATRRHVQPEGDSNQVAAETSDLELALNRHRSEVLARQTALREQKEQLVVESLRCSNALKRIEVAEANMLARKRLRDAGVAQHEIDELMPLVGFRA